MALLRYYSNKNSSKTKLEIKFFILIFSNDENMATKKRSI
jgi:hypothetical protein